VVVEAVSLSGDSAACGVDYNDDDNDDDDDDGNLQLVV
jgi:hypothetical protein